jgi:hypothetical protein
MVTSSRSYCGRCGVSLPSPTAECPYCSPQAGGETSVGSDAEPLITSSLGITLAQIGILLITLANGVVLFAISFLAVGGDGSAKGVHSVWIFGLIWIPLFAWAAYYFGARRGWATGLLIAACALPSAFAIGTIAAYVGVGFGAIFGYVSPQAQPIIPPDAAR